MQLRALLKNASLLGIQFSDCLDSDTTTLAFAPVDLDGLPPSFIAGLPSDKFDKSKLVLTLKYPDYFPVMRECKVSRRDWLGVTWHSSEVSCGATPHAQLVTLQLCCPWTQRHWRSNPLPGCVCAVWR